jgi:hypothetical protein
MHTENPPAMPDTETDGTETVEHAAWVALNEWAVAQGARDNLDIWCRILEAPYSAMAAVIEATRRVELAAGPRG